MDNPQKRRTIYFVWNFLNWGGGEIYLLAIMKIARSSWNICVLLPAGSLNIRYEFLKYALSNVPAVTLTQKITRQFSRIRSEAEIFNRLRRLDLRNNILHIEVVPWQSWILLTALSTLGANIFITLHNFLEGGTRMRQLVWKARLRAVSRLKRFHIFASNEDTKERFRGWFSDSFHKTIPVTYTSVDPEQISQAATADRDQLRQRFGIPLDRFVVLCVGQFIDRKGRWVFLDAARKTADENLLFVWLMPRLPNDEENRRIAEFGLADKFLPILSSSVGAERIDVLKFFKIADAFALPSFVEGLPIALLEAMAIGLPSISTNVYAIPEAVIHEKTGLLIEAGDSDALEQSIRRLKNESQLRTSLSKAGSDFVLQHFDERIASESVIRAYKGCFVLN